MTIAIVGAGAVGARVARLMSGDSTSSRADGDPPGIVVVDPRAEARAAARRLLGAAASVVADVDGFDRFGLVLLAGPPGCHAETARAAVRAGCSVVSVGDDADDVRNLLALDREARDRRAVVVAGAGFGPGLSCLLARLASRRFDVVDEVHVARVGTGGPACARQHHRALASFGHDWRDGDWVRRSGGSGRELLWFPSPVDGHDCYRGAFPDAFLLRPAFPTADRITARVAATRRDRLTMGLPMLRRPHPEGLVGAVRVEVRGHRGTSTAVHVLGSVERPAVAAAIVGVTTAALIADGAMPFGAYGLASVPDPVGMGRALMVRGLRFHRFEGTEDD